MTITTRLNDQRLVQLLAALPVRTKEAVDETTTNIRNVGAQLAPRDTGSLVSSLYITNGDESDYSQRAGEARSKNAEAVIVQEVRPEFVISLGGGGAGYMSVVGAAVAHGIFQELGTRFMGAHPFLIPAVEGSTSGFITAMSKVADL